MNPTFYIKEGDRLPAITGTVKDGDGVEVNLTGCTAKFIMSLVPGGTPVVNAAASILAGIPPVGYPCRLSYAFLAGETDVSATYYAEFEVTFPGGVLETFPNNGYISVVIGKDLG